MAKIKPLKLEWDDLKKMLFFDGVILTPDVRFLEQMADVLYDKEYAKAADPRTELYYMYRELCFEQDLQKFAARQIRHDVTVIPAMGLGKEANKTVGHYHTDARPGVSFPELYEVLAGEAHYLLMKRKKVEGKLKNDALEDAVLIKAKAGDKVLIPPNYGHITINPGPQTLVMANLVERNFKSDYEPIKQTRGGFVYELSDGKLAENPAFLHDRKIEIVFAARHEATLAMELAGEKTIYEEFVEKPEKFDFLARP